MRTEGHGAGPIHDRPRGRGRILLNECCASDPDRLRSMSARFTRRVLPGDTLTPQAWQVAECIHYETLGPAGQPVIDHGVLSLASKG